MQPADNTLVTLVSPELVLVDPLLRAAALAALPQPDDCLACRRSTVVGQRDVTHARVPERLEAVDTSSPVLLGGAPVVPDGVPTAPFEPAASGHHTALSLPALAAVLAAFLFAYFLGSPLLELVGGAALAIRPV